MFGLLSLIKYFSSFIILSLIVDLSSFICVRFVDGIISRGAGLGGSGVSRNLKVGRGDDAGDISWFSFGSSIKILGFGLLSHLILNLI